MLAACTIGPGTVVTCSKLYLISLHLKNLSYFLYPFLFYFYLGKSGADFGLDLICEKDNILVFHFSDLLFLACSSM